MVRQAVYYDEIDGQQFPYWYVISLDEGEISWKEDVYYFDISAPFEKFSRFDFDEYDMGVSIDSADIVRSNLKPGVLGITLQRVKDRIIEKEANPEHVRTFIILMSNIEESLLLSNKAGDY